MANLAPTQKYTHSFFLFMLLITAYYPYQHGQPSAHHNKVDQTDNRTHDENGNGESSSSAMKQTVITVIIRCDDSD